VRRRGASLPIGTGASRGRGCCALWWHRVWNNLFKQGELSMNPGRKRQLELFRILFHIVCFFCERQENCFSPEGVWKSELLVAATNFLGSLVRQLMYISGWSGGPVVFVVVGSCWTFFAAIFVSFFDNDCKTGVSRSGRLRKRNKSPCAAPLGRPTKDK